MQKFEKFARRKIVNDSYPVDTEALWKAIEPELHPPRRRIYLWLWLMLGFVLSASLLSHNPRNADGQIAEKIWPTTTVPISIAPVEKMEVQEKAEVAKLVIENTNEKREKQSSQSERLANVETEELMPLSKKKMPQLLPEYPIKGEVVSKAEPDLNKPIKPLNLLPIDALETTNDILSWSTPEEKDISEEPLAAKKINLAFGIRGGLSGQITQLSATDNQGVEIMKSRAGTERNLEMLDIGLELLLKSKKGWYLNTGIVYQRAVRRFEFNDQITKIEKIEGVAKIYQNPYTGLTSNELGELVQLTSETWKKVIYNKTHFVNLPVSIGFEYPRNKWTLGLEAGTLINWSVAYQGQIRGASAFYDLGQDTANWFKDRLRLRAQGSFLVGYHLGKRLQMLASATYRSPVVLSGPNNPVAQTQTSLGLQLTGRFWLH